LRLQLATQVDFQTREASRHDFPNEVNDYPSELFAPVFLQEVTSAFDDRVRLTLGAAHPFLKDLLAASGDGISVAESGEERFFEPGQE
jgi:hypothetical protein